MEYNRDINLTSHLQERQELEGLCHRQQSEKSRHKGRLQNNDLTSAAARWMILRQASGYPVEWVNQSQQQCPLYHAASSWVSFPSALPSLPLLAPEAHSPAEHGLQPSCFWGWLSGGPPLRSRGSEDCSRFQEPTGHRLSSLF